MLNKQEDKYVTQNVSNSSNNSLENFAKRVFDNLISDGVPPIPYYYKVYFFNELDNENEAFRKQVYELISLEESNDLEKDLEFEIKLKNAFKYSKELLNHVALTYKITKKLKELLGLQLKETAHITNNKALIKLINGFQNNLKIIDERLNREVEEIKNLYSQNVEVLKDIESNSVFDARYGIYNKNYFLNEVRKELNLINKFHHTSSLIMVKIQDDILSKLNSEKSRVLINRSLAKIMLKTSRRTDIVATFEENIFSMLLKHTDVIGAQKTVERLSDTLLNTSVFLEGEELTLKIVAGIVELKENRDVERFIFKALNTLKEAESNKELYSIGKVD
ncbi:MULTISPECIES: diguanylate cyclase domain-containing protein [unclassified Lebetimonas]|uniref:diguanylate cyclase domain-containing protein n=1 Tax=unclassified Lebetimonas TaxID=2648158 RepID=UPI0004640AB3|nr:MULTISPECIES: diguanylate cyclase [unclassified Lebetimonas]